MAIEARKTAELRHRAPKVDEHAAWDRSPSQPPSTGARSERAEFEGAAGQEWPGY